MSVFNRSLVRLYDDFTCSLSNGSISGITGKDHCHPICIRVCENNNPVRTRLHWRYFVLQLRNQP